MVVYACILILSMNILKNWNVIRLVHACILILTETIELSNFDFTLLIFVIDCSKQKGYI